MLDAILQKNIRLMDYELLTDDQGMRVVKFGTFAGYAGKDVPFNFQRTGLMQQNEGMIDTMCGLGQRLLGLGQSSPFLVGALIAVNL